MVHHELVDGMSEVAFPERYQPIQTFVSDRPYESLRVRVRIRSPVRGLDNVESSLGQVRADGLTPFRIPIVGNPMLQPRI